MSSIIFDIIFLLALIMVYAVLCASEIALVSSSTIKLEQLAENGNVKAKRALKLANSPNNYLSTLEIGMTLCSILMGTLGGVAVTERLQSTFQSIPFLEPHSETLSVSIVVGIITYLSVVLGDLIPMRLALINPESIACKVAKPISFISKMATPIVLVLSFSTDMLIKLLGVRESEEAEITEAEVRAILKKAKKAGILKEAMEDMVNRFFRFSDRPIKALMTPRPDLVWLDAEASIEKNEQEVINSTYYRFPVVRGSLDKFLGIVTLKNLLSAYMRREEINLKSMVQPALYVPETTKALKLLDLFKESGNDIAMVTNEFGSITGLVTVNDVVGTLVGELPSEDDFDDPIAVQRKDGSWLIDGLFPVDEIKDLVSQESFIIKEARDYHTLGGLVMDILGQMPREGDHFDYEGLSFEVMNMDGARVDKVLVEKIIKDEKTF